MGVQRAEAACWVASAAPIMATTGNRPDRVRENLMAADAERLLEFIVRNRQFRIERTVAEMEARATQQPEIIAEPAEVRGEEVAEARRHADAFARGLRAAWAAHHAGRAELPLDDRDAEENARA